MGRFLVTLTLWVAAVVGALATAFFVAMLLTPGYGDAVIAVVAGLSALWTAAAGRLLRRRSQDRRDRRRLVADDVAGGELLEQLVPRRRRWVLMAWGFAVATAVAVTVAVVNRSVGALVCAVVFAIVVWMSLVQLSPARSFLQVTTRGLVTRSKGRTRAHRWADVDGFRVYDVRTKYTTMRLVGWRVSGDAAKHGRAAKWLRWPHGVDDGLPTEYEGDPEELAARLQAYRDQHAKAGGRSGRRILDRST